MPLPGSTPIALIASPRLEQSTSLNVHINQQFIEATEATIINNITGDVLGPQATELMNLIERFGGSNAAALQSAVYEFEDVDAPGEKRATAKRRLKIFLRQLGGVAKDVSTDLLAKYVESKGL